MKLKKTLLLLLLLIILILVVYLFQTDIQSFIETFANWAYPGKDDRNGEVVKLIMNIIAGIVVIFGLYATFLRARATQKSVEKQEKTIKNQTHQIKLSHKSQTNEQFKNAIEHLGTDKEPIILGGISELHSIAKENPKDYSDVISNIFTSYLRSEANVKKDAEEINKTIIQTIVNYLLKTDIYSHKNINLTNCNLNSIDLNDISVEDSDFSFCILPWRLKNTNFKNCKISKCELTLGRYENIEFDNCELFQSKIRSSEFQNSTFKDNKKIQSIICIDSKFDNCSFETSFFKSNYFACEFLYCSFGKSDFTKAEFVGSSFRNLELPDNDIYEVNFSGCGFDDVVSNSIILNSKFNGLKSESTYYSQFFEKQIEKSTHNKANLSGFNHNPAKVSKCEFNSISEGNKIEYLKKYKDLIEKDN